MPDIRKLTVRILPDRLERHFNGRDAWALHALIVAGEQGCTPIDHPGPRWSGYVHKLRCAGLVVETIEERHGGAYAGRHARYVLRSAVEIVSIGDMGRAA